MLDNVRHQMERLKIVTRIGFIKLIIRNDGEISAAKILAD